MDTSQALRTVYTACAQECGSEEQNDVSRPWKTRLGKALYFLAMCLLMSTLLVLTLVFALLAMMEPIL